MNEVDSNDAFDSDDSCEDEADAIEREFSLKDELRTWALKYQITHCALNNLLTILSKKGFGFLPVDSRTLLETPKAVDVREMGKGQFWYNGVEKCLNELIQLYMPNLRTPVTLVLKFNIDGLPISKSSKYQFWPILMLVENFTQMHPMVVAIYYGDTKPPLTEFFEQFVEETNTLVKQGIKRNDIPISLHIKCFICDSPARSFIKGKCFI